MPRQLFLLLVLSFLIFSIPISADFEESGVRIMSMPDFSYEQSGFSNMRQYGLPTFEGYSKENILFSMVFQHISDYIDPRQIKEFCSEPNKIEDIVISKLKERVGDLHKICTDIEEQEKKCYEFSEQNCQNIGAMMNDNIIGVAHITEMEREMARDEARAFSCPVKKEDIIKLCKKRNKLHLENQLRYAIESCKNQITPEQNYLIGECERLKRVEICEEERYISKCIDGLKAKQREIEKREKCPPMSIPQCAEGSVIEKKVDDKGCVYYSCGISDVVPHQKNLCKETDNGFDINNRGTTYYGELGREDYCKDPNTLIEYGCKEDKTFGDKQYSCDFGCKEGACLTKSEEIHDNKSTDIQCPDLQISECPSGLILDRSFDDKGCPYYFCRNMSEEASITGSSLARITAKDVLELHENFLKECTAEWREQEHNCENILNKCNKESFVEVCIYQEKKNYENLLANIEQNCETQTNAEIKSAEQRCNRITEDREHCLKLSRERCEHIKGIAEKCQDSINEESIRKFITDEARKRCRFSDIIKDEMVVNADRVEILLAVLNTADKSDIDKIELFVENLKEQLKLQDTTVYKGIINPKRFADIKLLPFIVSAKINTVSQIREDNIKEEHKSSRFKEVAGKLASLRDSELPDEYLYIIEDKASDVLDVSEKLEEINDKESKKGFFYKIRLFFGLAKKAEEQEIAQLTDSRGKLANSIDILQKLSEDIPNDVAKAILKEQVEDLNKQIQDIDSLIGQKKKKAKGLFG